MERMWKLKSDIQARVPGILMRTVAATTLLVFVSGLSGVGLGVAWAVDNGTSGAGNVQTSALQSDFGSCEESCSDVFAAVQSISGKDSSAENWTKGGFTTAPANPFAAAHHEKCANLCSATDSANYPNAAHCFEEPTFTQGCSLPDQVLRSDTSKSCETANKMSKGCKFYNSTLLGQCEVAYRATASNGYQETLLTLDAATAGVCATACWADKTGFGSSMHGACQVVGVAAGLFELAGSFAVAGEASSGHDGRGAGFDVAGGIGGAAIAANGLANLGWDKSLIGEVTEGTFNGKAVKLDGGTWKEVGEGETLGKAVRDQEGAKDAAAENKKQKESCLTMGIALALGGIRLWSMLDASGTQKEACTQAQDLYSQAFAAAAASGGDSVINPNNPLVVSSSGGGLTGETASGAAMSVTGGVGGDKSTPSVGDIMGGEGFAATAEGKLLGPSGLGNIVGPLASQTDRGAFRKAISQGPAGFTQAALGGVGVNAAQAQAANDIVKRAYDKAPQLASKIGGSMYAGGGGGSGSKVAASAGGSPFGGLFGAKSGPGGTDAMSFGAVQRDPAGRIISSDIWHTGTDKNLFQIVSERVRATEGRLK